MKDKGFTLIEVLAALVIFSVAMVGLVTMNIQSAKAVQVVNEKMLAGIVADNVIIEARRERTIEVGERRGEETSFGRDFEWTREIQTTDLEGFYKIVVKVRLVNFEQVVMERTAFRSGSAS